MAIRCEHERFDGRQCINWAIKTTNPPRCIAHLRGADRKDYFLQKALRDSDPRNVLKEELRIVRKFKHSLERSRLIIEIMKMLRDLDKKESEPEPEKESEAGKPETVHEYARRLRGK